MKYISLRQNYTNIIKKIGDLTSITVIQLNLQKIIMNC